MGAFVPWTPEEEALVRAHYRGGRPIPAALLAALPGRSRDAVISKAERLGLAAPVAPDWTAAEDALVRVHYPRRKEWPALRRALPWRSWNAIVRRSYALAPAPFKPHWTPQETAYLRMHWQLLGMRALQKRLRRSRVAIYRRAVALGLPLGAPQGHESFAAACRRAGYDASALRRILDAAGVRRWRSLGPRATVVSHWYVDPFEVDEAVAAWHRTETVAEAARRRGLCDVTFRAALVRRGLIVPRGRAVPVRIRSEVADHVARALRGELVEGAA